MKIICKLSQSEVIQAKKCCEYYEKIDEYRMDCKNCPLNPLAGKISQYLCEKVDDMEEKYSYIFVFEGKKLAEDFYFKNDPKIIKKENRNESDR